MDACFMTTTGGCCEILSVTNVQLECVAVYKYHPDVSKHKAENMDHS